MAPSVRGRTAFACCLLFPLFALLGPPGSARAEDGAARPEAADPAAALAERLRAKDDGARLDAAREARGVDDARLTRPLLKLLGDKSVIIRLAAIEALGTRVDRASRRKAATALAARVDRLEARKEDREEPLATLAALRALGQPGPIKRLIHGIRPDSEIEVVQARLMAVAAVPAAEAIERLIQFLAKGRRGGLGPQRQAAVRALQFATGQKGRGLGHDPDRWRAWWRANEKTFDFEAVAAARREAARKAEEKRRRAEERARRKRERKQKKKPGDPAPDGGSGG